MDATKAAAGRSGVPALTIRGVETAAVLVPMAHPLGTSAGVVRTAPLLLVDLTTEEGVTGRTYVFCYRPSVPRAVDALLRDAVALVAGEAVAPVELSGRLARRFALLGVASVVRMALSALDVALWDALSAAAGLPLAAFLGARPRPIPAYNSSGLGLMAPGAAAAEAQQLLAGGFRSVKLRLGHAALADDLAVTREVRRAIPDGTELPVDYNQALTVADAIRRGRTLEGEGIAWLEEPIRHDDYAGCAAVARALSVPVQLGENFNGPEAMAQALAAGASDYVMPDAARIGGVTGWLHAAGLAAAHGVEMSSHLYPELSAHLLAATPTAHWLEYVDWASPILEEPLEIRDGGAVVPGRPGIGLAWRREAVEALALGG